jgi:hypothetical protein
MPRRGFTQEPRFRSSKPAMLMASSLYGVVWAGGDYASRPPLTRAGAIKVFLLKTVSYLVLLLMLAIFADAFWTGLPKPPVQLIWFD